MIPAVAEMGHFRGNDGVWQGLGRVKHSVWL